MHLVLAQFGAAALLALLLCGLTYALVKRPGTERIERVTRIGRWLRELPARRAAAVLAVRPEITGWAQVRYGYANNLEEETEKMRHDLYYVKYLSPWLDLRVLVDTVRIALLGHPLARERFAAQPTLHVH